MEDMDKDHDGYITVDEYISKLISISGNTIVLVYLYI